MKQILAILAFILGLVQLSCEEASGHSNQEDLDAFIQSYVDGYLKHESEMLNQEAETLVQDAVAFCETSDAAHRTALANQYERTFLQWKRLELARFGPFDEAPLKIYSKLDGWVVDVEVIDETVNDFTAETDLTQLGANRRGFPALDYLLFGDSERDPAQDCLLFSSYADDILLLTSAWYDGFFGGEEAWSQHLLNPTGEKMLMDQTEVLTMILQDMVDATYLIRTEKVEAPVSEDGLELNLIESRHGDLGIPAIRATVEATRDIINGSEKIPTSLADLYNPRVEDGQAQIDTIFEAFDQIFEAHGSSLQSILEENGAAKTELADALRSLTVFLRTDVMGNFGLTVSFTDSDGD